MAYTLASGSCYIDLTDGNDSTGDGSQGNPWKTLTNITSEENVYFKKGSSGNIGGEDRKVLSSISGMTWDVYGEGDDPVINSYQTTVQGNWVEVDATDGDSEVETPGDSNLWRYDIGGTSGDPAVLVNFGSLGQSGIRIRHWNQISASREGPTAGRNTDTIDADYEWTTVIYTDTAGFTTRSNYLYVYAESNPHTYYSGPIYYQVRWTGFVLTIKDCPDFTLSGLKFQYCGEIFRIRNDQGNTYFDGLRIHDIVVDNCSNVARFDVSVADSTGWIRDFKVYNVTATDLYHTAFITNDRIRQGEFYGWNVDGCGISESVGGMYFGECDAPSGEEILVYSNILNDVKYGRWWTADGAAIYTDSNSGGVWVNRNKITNSYKALHDNSGYANNKYIGNVADDCQILFQGSDNLDNGLATTDVLYNTIINAGNTQHFSGENVGVLDFKNGVIGDNYNVKNNIVVITDNSNCPYAIRTDESITVDEDYNAVYGYTTAIVDGSNAPLALGSNSITDDTQVTASYTIPAGSPAENAANVESLDSWFKDYEGKAFSADPDMGAIQIPYEATSMSYRSRGYLLRRRRII